MTPRPATPTPDRVKVCVFVTQATATAMRVAVAQQGLRGVSELVEQWATQAAAC